MTLEEQRQFILSGAMYNDLTQELVQARERAVRLTTAYSESYGQPQKEREKILKELLGSV